MATAKRTSRTQVKKASTPAASAKRRASLKAVAPVRRKRAPSRATVAEKSASAAKGTKATPTPTPRRASAAGRGTRKAGVIKRALKKGFAELVKVGT